MGRLLQFKTPCSCAAVPHVLGQEPVVSPSPKNFRNKKGRLQLLYSYNCVGAPTNNFMSEALKRPKKPRGAESESNSRFKDPRSNDVDVVALPFLCPSRPKDVYINMKVL